MAKKAVRKLKQEPITGNSLGWDGKPVGKQEAADAAKRRQLQRNQSALPLDTTPQESSRQHSCARCGKQKPEVGTQAVNGKTVSLCHECLEKLRSPNEGLCIQCHRPGRGYGLMEMYCRQCEATSMRRWQQTRAAFRANPISAGVPADWRKDVAPEVVAINTAEAVEDGDIEESDGSIL